MSKRLIVILALAFVVGLNFAAYAEVQNVKVSGDLTVSGVFRNDYDLVKTSHSGPGTMIPANTQDKETDWLSIVRVRVDADLTDNVIATVRLLNERNWNGDSTTGVENNRNVGLTGTNVNNENKVDIDLAYVTLKEFLYSPLTLTVGRQELHFGNDFIIGDPDTNMVALKSTLAEGDLSARKAFDAIRITLDYNPLVIDGVYAKVAENSVTRHDGTDLYGLNASYEVDKNTTVEGYFFSKIKGSQNASVTNIDTGLTTSFDDVKNKSDKVNTVGVRVVNKSVKNLTLDGQVAYQFGTYNPRFDPNATHLSATDKAQTVRRSAYAVEVLATYDLKDISKIAKYSPSVTGVYVHLSGSASDLRGKKTYSHWDPMFENQTLGHIINGIMTFSNANILGLSLKGKPVDDVTLKFDAVGLWTAKHYTAGNIVYLSGIAGTKKFKMGKGPFLGQEYDLTVTYDYTEDVQLSVLGGVFVPTKNVTGYIDGNPGDNRAVATELIGSMKVTF